MWRIVALGVLVLVIVAVKVLPWWAILGLLGALVVAGVLFGKKLLGALFTLPFRAKGRVLHGARAEVHSVTAAAAPVRPDGPIPLSWYTVEATITPAEAAGDGSFKLWEPGELVFVRPDSKPGPPKDDEEDWGSEQLEILQDGGFREDEGDKLAGPQRLRLLVGLPPDVKRARFRYYFEVFGEVNLS